MVWFILFYLIMMAGVAQFLIIPTYSNEHGIFEMLAPEQYKQWLEVPNSIKTTITLIVSFFWWLILLATIYVLILQAINGPRIR
jgi:hypothetical protein